MPARSPYLPPSDAPLRARLVLGWGLFFAFVIGGIVLAWTHGRSVPFALEFLSR